jgi:hypothetical protein
MSRVGLELPTDDQRPVWGATGAQALQQRIHPLPLPEISRDFAAAACCRRSPVGSPRRALPAKAHPVGGGWADDSTHRNWQRRQTPLRWRPYLPSARFRRDRIRSTAREVIVFRPKRWRLTSLVFLEAALIEHARESTVARRVLPECRFLTRTAPPYHAWQQRHRYRLRRQSRRPSRRRSCHRQLRQ